MSTYMPKQATLLAHGIFSTLKVSHSVELLLRLLTFFVASTSQLTHHTLTAATM